MFNARTRRATVAGAATLALLGVGTSAYAGGGHLPLLDRTAKGVLDVHGGAMREAGDQTKIIDSSVKKGPAKNVILIIGDGMGDSEITIARNYLLGAGKAFKGIDALPMTGQMTHYSVRKNDGLPDYDPDSAATGTNWATGTKTYDNAISVDRHGKPQKTLLELAKAGGMATGNVSTAEIEDATPAVLVSHISARSCYGPVKTSTTCASEAKENGGLGSIAEQMLDTRPDVTMGGGSATFDEVAKAGKWSGKTLAQQAKDRGYQYLTDKSQLAGVKSADQKAPLMALFSKNNMPVKFAPSTTAQGTLPPAEKCQTNPEFSSVPTLKEMTDKSIGLLTKNAASKKNGFFLQIESASIDKQDHAANACGQIGETAQLDDAVQSALNFAKADGNTIVIVTADHAHTSQIVDGATPGLNTQLTTADNAPMVVAYGTSAAGGSQQHTGSQLRVAGYGPGAANLVGLIDQTDLFRIMGESVDHRAKK